MRTLKLKPNTLISDSGMLRDIATLMSGAVGAQVLSLLLIPFVTRLYSIENFGVMTLFSTTVSVVAVFCCGQYERAIVLPKEDEEAWDVAVLALIILICVCVLCLIVLIPFCHSISRLIFKTDDTILLWLIPAAVFSVGARLILNNWSTKKKEFEAIAVSGISATIGNQGVKILCGLTVGDRVGGLLAGTIGSSMFPDAVLSYKLLRKYRRIIKRIPKKEDIYYVIKKYRNFPIYSVWSDLIVVLGRNIPVFLLSYYFNNEAVGAFGLANNALRIPISIISTSTQRVFLQRAAGLHARRKPISSFMIKTTLCLFGLGIVPFGMLMVLGPQLFSIVFGTKWILAGKYAQVLTPWLFAIFINSPATTIITVFQKQKFNLILNVVSFCAKVLCFPLAMSLHLSLLFALLLFSSVSAMHNMILIVFAIKTVLSADSSLTVKGNIAKKA